MNVALPALIVFFVLLPGFLFRSRLKRAERLSLDYSPFGQVVTEAVLWAAVLHAVWLTGTWITAHRTVRSDVLLKFVSSDNAMHREAIEALTADMPRVVWYFATLLMFAFVVPTLSRMAITHWRLDRQAARFSSLLRFHAAPWYYLLTGADFAASDKPDLIAVAAIVNAAGRPMLYYGIVDDFYFDPDGRLDRVVLERVMRRPLDSDKVALDGTDRLTDRFYPIDGDYFVLRYAEAITFNVEYIKLAPADPLPHDA